MNKTVDLDKLSRDVKSLTEDVIVKSKIKAGELLVLGCSSSEVIGGVIGKNSSLEVGEVIVKGMLEVLQNYRINFAVQGCEHINRALVVERSVMMAEKFEEVSVIPAVHAGGSCSVAAFKLFNDPVEVEHVVAKAGIDIGDTAIGMHIKHVAVPIRPKEKFLGAAHVTALGSRPKLIGGARAVYE